MPLPFPAFQEPSATTLLALSRGLPVEGSVRYDVADTTLDPAQPDRAFGGDALLRGGDGRTILLRVDGLDRLLRGRKILRARIRLTQVTGGAVSVKSVSRVLAPWGEGPSALAFGRPALPTRSGADPVREAAPFWAATWKQRRGGRINWERAGAQGEADAAPVPTAVSTDVDGVLEVDGLTAAFQAMADDPTRQGGLAITLTGPAEFASMDAREGRPVILLDVAPAPARTGPDLAVVSVAPEAESGGERRFVATVTNLGDAPSSPFTGEWSVGERPTSAKAAGEPLAPGASRTFEIRRPAGRFEDPREGAIAFRISGGDANPANDALATFETARTVSIRLAPGALARLGGRNPLDWARERVAAFHEAVLNRSRYSFALEGPLARVNVVRAGEDVPPGPDVVEVGPDDVGDSPALDVALARLLGAPDLRAENVVAPASALTDRLSSDRFPGLLGYGETRSDLGLPARLALPDEPAYDPVLDANPPLVGGPLAMTDVIVMEAVRLGREPVVAKTLVVRALDLLGRPLPNVELGLIPNGSGEPVKTAKTSAAGSALFAVAAGGFDPKGLTLVRGRLNGQDAYAWIKGRRLLDEGARGGGEIAFLDLRFDLNGVELEADDLARGKIPNDSVGTPADVLARLTDGSGAGVPFGGKKGDWIEVDLGRDRTVGEVRIAGTLPGRFQVVGYGTGQPADDASPLLREVDHAWAVANRGGGKDAPYRVPPTRVRYLRLIRLEEGDPGVLTGFTVRAARVN